MLARTVYSRSLTSVILRFIFVSFILFSFFLCSFSAEQDKVGLRVELKDARYNKENSISLDLLEKHILISLDNDCTAVVNNNSENIQFSQHCAVNVDVGYLDFYQTEAGTWIGKCMLTSTVRDIKTDKRSVEFHSTVSIPFERGSRAFKKDNSAWALTVVKEAATALAQDVLSHLPEASVVPQEKSASLPLNDGSPSVESIQLGAVKTRWALVIGISKYKDEKIPGLKYAEKDAKAFYKWLTASDGGGYSSAQVKLLCDEDATSAAIREALFNWLKKPIAEDLITIYYAGHGSPESPDNLENLYLLPYDVDYSKISTTGFPMWDMETSLKRFIKAKRVIIIADACHSAGVGGQFDIARRAGRGMKVNPIVQGFDKLTTVGRSVCVLSSAEASQFSQEDEKWGGGHGVFTYYLLEGLKGMADSNKDGSVSIGELAPYLSEKVRRATGSVQCPRMAGSFDPVLTIGR